MERANPGGSIKDRIALAMIEDAEERGILGPDSVIIEPTSGNTGIGLALVCAVKGYRLILTMPESMSIERRKLMTGYGAELELTPRELGMKGAIARANELAAEIPGAWIPMQFDNPANPAVHRRDHGRGDPRPTSPTASTTSSPASGPAATSPACAEVLKPRWPDLKVYAVEPTLSPVLSGGTHSPAPDPGDRRRLHPGRHADRSSSTGSSRSRPRTRWPTRGARPARRACWSASRRARRWRRSRSSCRRCPTARAILTFTYDTGERYLSIDALWG